MKRFKSPLTLAFTGIVTLSLLFTGCLHDRGIRTDMSYDNLKAISLRELQKVIIHGPEKEFVALKSFYGLTSLYGFLWDEEGNDLILFGKADKEKEALNFDDFVVSLRNAYCLNCKTEGNTVFYSEPSCTIDPDPNTMGLLNKLNTSDNEDNQTNRGRSWEEICARPQTVGVFGIPFNSHLASLMVNADYMLKDITNGHVKVEIEGGFKSLHQLRKEIAEESLKNNVSLHLGSPMNRFEFTAPSSYFRNSEKFYLLYSQPVLLVTEEQYLSKSSISGTGKPDSLAQEFADSFNTSYEEISKVHPMYESLMQSYRVFSIAKAIEESQLITDTSFFSEILNHYPLDQYNVPSTLPGKSMLDNVTYKTDAGSNIYYMYSCGGVNLGSKVLKSPVRAMKEMEITNSIILARPGAGSVEWNAEKVNAKFWVLNINWLNLLPKSTLFVK